MSTQPQPRLDESDTFKQAMARYPDDHEWEVLTYEEGDSPPVVKTPAVFDYIDPLTQVHDNAWGEISELGEEVMPGHRRIGMRLLRSLAPTVSRFSPCGPCTTYGLLVGETAKFWKYMYRNGDDIRVRSVRKRTDEHYSPAHVKACHSCSGGVNYPHGRMD